MDRGARRAISMGSQRVGHDCVTKFTFFQVQDNGSRGKDRWEWDGKGHTRGFNCISIISF